MSDLDSPVDDDVTRSRAQFMSDQLKLLTYQAELVGLKIKLKLIDCVYTC